MRVYPRTHGGTDTPWAAVALSSGLSPHTRGNPFLPSLFRSMSGSIPAHTGEPGASTAYTCARKVYPRTHGGTEYGPGEAADARGLSPHTRGNRSRGSGRGGWRGSIPAHTGEPGFPGTPPCWRGVYPRTHGGTSANPTSLNAEEGLSPHTRGNHDPPHGLGRVVGSIPAHTGEPWPISS